jgi:phosphatidylserine decarboxylase
MSLFNVHVNRIPVKGSVKHISYHPGKFFSADLDKASEQNEKNIVCMETDTHQQIAVIQIAGLIARRIVCWVKEGDTVLQGQRFGLIRFGSRLEVFMADNSKVNVHLGQKVKAGETIVGYLP